MNLKIEQHLHIRERRKAKYNPTRSKIRLTNLNARKASKFLRGEKKVNLELFWPKVMHF